MPSEQFGGFNSAKAHLNGATLGAWPFLAPSIATLAPFVTGVMSARAYANVIWLFGQPLAGSAHPTDELLAAIGQDHARFTRRRRGKERPEATASDALAAIQWWVSKTNLLFSIMTDITLFVDAQGGYEPVRHAAFLISVERLFTDVLEVLTNTGRNEGAKLRAAYDALDCIDGLRLGLLPGMKKPTFADLTSTTKVARAVDDLERSLPSGVGAVVLPKCIEARDALEHVKEGFFLERHVGADGLVDVPVAGGGTREVLWDEAIRNYIRIDRNSAHSLLKEIDPVREPGKLVTFVAHDGELDPAVADLAYLWLVTLLDDPERMRIPILRQIDRDSGRTSSPA